MGTRIRTLVQLAGVTCPKSTGEMDENETCRKCANYQECIHQIRLAIGVEE